MFLLQAVSQGVQSAVDLFGTVRALPMRPLPLMRPSPALPDKKPPPGLATLDDALCVVVLSYLRPRDISIAGAACHSLRQVGVSTKLQLTLLF